MAFTDNVVYVKTFPEEYSLTGAEEVDAGVLGVLSVKIMDSLLVVGTSGDPAWKVFSLDDLSEVTSLIRKGNGPGEFLSRESSCLFPGCLRWSSTKKTEIHTAICQI